MFQWPSSVTFWWFLQLLSHKEPKWCKICLLLLLFFANSCWGSFKTKLLCVGFALKFKLACKHNVVNLMVIDLLKKVELVLKCGESLITKLKLKTKNHSAQLGMGRGVQRRLEPKTHNALTWDKGDKDLLNTREHSWGQSCAFRRRDTGESHQWFMIHGPQCELGWLAASSTILSQPWGGAVAP